MTLPKNIDRVFRTIGSDSRSPILDEVSAWSFVSTSERDNVREGISCSQVQDLRSARTVEMRARKV